MKSVVLGFLGLVSLGVHASSCYQDDDSEFELERYRSLFEVNIAPDKESSLFISVEVPSEIEGVSFDELSVARSGQGSGSYFFPIRMEIHEHGKLTTGFQIEKSMLEGGEIQFSYNRCNMVFTYRIDSWVET